MKFNCGETWEAKKERLGKWHPVFLLFPKTMEERNGKYVCYWLTFIEGRASWDGFWDRWHWEYRLKQK